MNFKEAMADQDYKSNLSALICQNCLHLENSQIPARENERPVFRTKCGIGRFFVKNTGTCRIFESK